MAKRRTVYQSRAHKIYPRLAFISGDGEYIVLTRCPHQQVPGRWRYMLAPTQEAAEAILSGWAKTGCHTYTCQGAGQHKIWRLS